MLVSVLLVLIHQCHKSAQIQFQSSITYHEEPIVYCSSKTMCPIRRYKRSPPVCAKFQRSRFVVNVNLGDHGQFSNIPAILDTGSFATIFVHKNTEVEWKDKQSAFAWCDIFKVCKKQPLLSDIFDHPIDYENSEPGEIMQSPFQTLSADYHCKEVREKFALSANPSFGITVPIFVPTKVSAKSGHISPAIIGLGPPNLRTSLLGNLVGFLNEPVFGMQLNLDEKVGSFQLGNSPSDVKFDMHTTVHSRRDHWSFIAQEVKICTKYSGIKSCKTLDAPEIIIDSGSAPILLPKDYYKELHLDKLKCEKWKQYGLSLKIKLHGSGKLRLDGSALQPFFDGGTCHSRIAPTAFKDGWVSKAIVLGPPLFHAYYTQFSFRPGEPQKISFKQLY